MLKRLASSMSECCFGTASSFLTTAILNWTFRFEAYYGTGRGPSIQRVVHINGVFHWRSG